MDQHRIVPHDQWIAARRDFLAKEKEFTRLRDELSRERRELPWERVEKTYVFDGPGGSMDRGYARGPERALMSALLFDGLQSYVSYVVAGTERVRSKYREAFNWVNKRGSEYVFSFDSVCEALGIDPDFLRYGLLNACNSRLFDWGRSRRNF